MFIAFIRHHDLVDATYIARAVESPFDIRAFATRTTVLQDLLDKRDLHDLRSVLREVLCVKTTFLVVFLFPPPATGTFWFIVCNWSCARCTTDGFVPLIMQSVVRNVLLVDIRPDVARYPRCKWIEFSDLVTSG